MSEVRIAFGRGAAMPSVDGASATPAGSRGPFADVDVGCWIGGYPFRDVPHPEPAVLAGVLEREGVTEGWVGSLPAAFHRDPAPANAALFAALGPHPTLRAAPAIRPDWPGWERALGHAISAGAAAIRTYPTWYGLGDQALARLGGACAEAGVPLLVQVRFEDLRQRHRHDVAGDVSAATLRALARARTGVALVVLGAGRETIEETAWGLTPAERERVWFDLGWCWGPPEDHVSVLLRTLGPSRFVHASHWPLRLVQQTRALLALADPPVDASALASGRAIAAAARGVSAR